jgi:hypothetical protein
MKCGLSTCKDCINFTKDPIFELLGYEGFCDLKKVGKDSCSVICDWFTNFNDLVNNF